MDTVRVDICYRPMRLAWAIESDDADAFRCAVQFSNSFWGGRYNPIIFVDQEAAADRLIDAFRPDLIWPLSGSERTNKFVDR